MTAADVAIARRAGWRLGLIDVAGRVLARRSECGAVLVSPGPDVASPARLDPTELVSIPLDIADSDLPSGLGLGLDLAIMRVRPDVGAIAVGSPLTAMAFGSVRREVLPLTHTGAEIALSGAAWIEPESYLGMANRSDDTDAVARSIGCAGFVHVPGVALLALGFQPLDALRRLDVLETLARMTAIATRLDPAPTTVTREEADAIPAQRPTEPRPSRDYRRFYRSLDRPAPTAAGNGGWAAEPQVQAKRDVALSCRILALQGDLVAFFEHVSHRIPGLDDRFVMSPAKDFAAMQPDDVAAIATSGDCEQLDGEIPAAPFRWYHRDVFEARPDVQAIVHTHALYGRAYAMTNTASPPVHRYAVHGMRGMAPPTFPKPSLLFDAADRGTMLQLLGDGAWVHARSHGTDFCAADIATATVAAIHHERHLRFYDLTRGLGEPCVLSDAVLARLAERGPTALQWWAAYADALAA